MEKILLKADKRSEIGKGGARSLRRRGIMPAVMYSGDTSTPVKVNSKEISRLMFNCMKMERRPQCIRCL